MTIPSCRACAAPLTRTLVDLGLSPLANSYVPQDRTNMGEHFYPLHVLVCDQCHLVQIEAFETPEAIFSDYAYFSSFSTSWLRHAEAYARSMTERFGLGPKTRVVEIASNDGYLLQYFVKAGISVMGVEPAGNVAEVARTRGVPTEVCFFGEATARQLREQGGPANLMAANNVLAHVPNLHDFIEGFRVMLADTGAATFEFPHLLQLLQHCQFDTVYHEHFSYLSLGVVDGLLRQHGMRIFDVEELPTHGGSLRVFTCLDRAPHVETPAPKALIARERAAGLFDASGYQGFADKVVRVKCDALAFLIEQRRTGKKVCAYGAAAKGNTFLNYCGIGPELVQAVADKNPVKQGTLLPGSRIPVVSPDAMLAMKPDALLILPWNLVTEISGEMAEIHAWGGCFVTAIPSLRVIP